MFKRPLQIRNHMLLPRSQITLVFFRIPNVSRKFHSEIDFLTTVTFWNIWPCECISEHSNFNLLLLSILRILIILTSYQFLFHSYHRRHSSAIFTVALESCIRRNFLKDILKCWFIVNFTKHPRLFSLPTLKCACFFILYLRL